MAEYNGWGRGGHRRERNRGRGGYGRRDDHVGHGNQGFGEHGWQDGDHGGGQGQHRYGDGHNTGRGNYRGGRGGYGGQDNGGGHGNRGGRGNRGHPAGMQCISEDELQTLSQGSPEDVLVCVTENEAKFLNTFKVLQPSDAFEKNGQASVFAGEV